MSIAMALAGDQQVDEFVSPIGTSDVDADPASDRANRNGSSTNGVAPESAEATFDGQPQSQSGGFRSSVGSNGRLRLDGLADADRHLSVAIHLTPFAAYFFPPAVFAPLVIWLVRKDKSTFVDDHGREMLNVLISALLVGVVGFLVGWIPLFLGWVATIMWFIVTMINMIRAASAAGRGEYFRYPMTFRFLS
jgi:uncharacterized protein